MEYNLKQLYFATLDYIWDRVYSKDDLLIYLSDIDGWTIPRIEVNTYKLDGDNEEHIAGKVLLLFMDDYCQVTYRKTIRDESEVNEVTTFEEIKAIFDLIDSFEKEE